LQRALVAQTGRLVFIPRIALTAGEPAGIGAELLVRLAQTEFGAELIAIADPGLLRAAAETLQLPLQLDRFVRGAQPQATRAGGLRIVPVTLPAANRLGTLNVANATYVLALLQQAAEGAASGEFAAVVTAPVHKGIINQAGHRFTGHTEFFAEHAAVAVVMMLAAGGLRVALATTHLPLQAVPAAITRTSLTTTLRILHHDLREFFGIAKPRITVLGLNPHAGEGGHLGHEEIDVLMPVIDALQQEGMQLRGPLPADTGFLPRELARTDAVLAMYHDQGLPVLKYAGFGAAVNITLGLPWIRTSVDHGTALDIAGRGVAEVGSLRAATELAIELAVQRQARRQATA